ncbi:MAG: RHS repeat-associated core domain-containing protein, partial [Vulcanimicrobiota bacterium]
MPAQEFWRYDNDGIDINLTTVDGPVYPSVYLAVVAYNDVTGLNSDGTYIIRYDWSGGATVDSSNPGTWEEWKYVRSNNGTVRSTYNRGYDGFSSNTDPDFVEVAFEGGNDPTEVFLSTGMYFIDYCQKVVEQADKQTFQDKVPGPWTVKRTISGPGFIPTPLTVKNFDFRMMAIRNFRVEKVQVDPKSEDNTVKFRGDIYLLPEDWQPDDSQTWSYTGYDLFAYDASGNTVFHNFTRLHPTTMGLIGQIEVDWDGRYDDLGTTLEDNDPVEGVFTAYASAGTRTEYVGPPAYILGVGDISDKVDLKLCGCQCKCKNKTGSNYLVFDVMAGMLQSVIGPPLECSIAYCSEKKDNGPQSMGFGWSGPSTARLLEPAGQGGSLVYRGDGGSNLRWDLVSGNYLATTSDNYVKVEKTTDPDATYVLTFPDQSKREFNSDGRLMRSLDRNGLAARYEYTSGVLTSMTDASGQVLNYEFREDGQLVSVSSLSRQTVLDYDENSRLSVITDPEGQTTTFVYNENGLLWQIKDTRDEVAMTFEYDSLGREVLRQNYDQSRIRTLYEGDASGLAAAESEFNFALGTYYAARFGEPGYSCPRSVSIQEDLTAASPTGVTVSFFDRNGNLACIDQLVLPLGSFEGQEEAVFNRTVMEFNDPHSRYLMTRSINPNLAETRWTYDADGNVKSVVDNEGNKTEFYYAQELDSPLNPLHKNLLRKLVRPGSSLGSPSLEMTYDENGNLEKVYDEKRNHTDYIVNSLGLVESVTDRRGNATTMTYDPTTHRLLTITSPVDANDPNSGRSVSLGYDAYGNVNSVRDELDHETRYEFDGVDRVTQITDARGKIVAMNYVDGLLANVVAPANAGSVSANRTTRFSYDDSGRLTLSESEVAASSFQARVGYAYTGFSQLKQLKRWKDSAQKQTEHVYDILGRMVSSKDFGNRESTVTYQPFCVENTVTTARGVLRRTSFDTLCRITRQENTDETRRFWHDSRGRLIKVAVGAHYQADGVEPAPGGMQPGRYQDSGYAVTTRFLYNELDLVTQVMHGTDFSLLYEYDEEENVTKVTDVFGRVTEYSYLNDGRLFQVTHQGEVFTYEYDEVGRLARITYPGSTGLVASFTKTDNSSGWNENGQLLCLRYLKAGSHFQRFEYTYDDSGNRTQLIDTPQNLSSQVTWNYNYDWLNRLVEVKRDGDTVSIYTYDESDNRIELELPQEDKVWTYGYDIADRILSRSLNVSGGGATEFEAFEHDDDGNMISRTLSSDSSTIEYVWDADNRLSRIEPGLAEAVYDFDGIRRSGHQNGEGYGSRYFTSGGMPLSEQARDGSQLSFIQGHQLLGLNDDGAFFFYISDGLGSIRLIVDEDGDAVASFSTDEFGVEEDSSGTRTDLNYMTFVGGFGMRKDPTGLYYARQRYYAPELGRWLSADPIGFSGGLNLYGYCGQ